MENQPLQLEDLRRLLETEAPDLAEQICNFLEQDDPDLFEDTISTEDKEGVSTTVVRRDPPEEWISFQSHESQLERAARARTSKARRTLAHKAWNKFLAQDPSLLPPRFQLAEFLEKLYDLGTPTARVLLQEIILKVPLTFGIWAGLKRVYKRAEAEFDAEIFGVLAARFDWSRTPFYNRQEVNTATLIYLRRRAWRFLRQLGTTTPEIYPQFAAQVLRHYPSDVQGHSLWVLPHILAHGSKKFTATSFFGNLETNNVLKERAFSDAWKRSPAPLIFILETCQHNAVARFAIQGLQKDFPEHLRNITPVRLARLSSHKLESIDDFFVDILTNSPEFHQGKLRTLGLHEAVLNLLESDSKKARLYAIDYARAHAQDIEKERLLTLLDSYPSEVSDFAKTQLSSRSPRTLGYAFLGLLLSKAKLENWANKALNEDFERKDLPLTFLTEMLYGQDQQRKWAQKYIESKYTGNEIGAQFWRDTLDDKRAEENYNAVEIAFKFLRKYEVAKIGTRWLIESLTRDWLSNDAAQLLARATRLDDADVERLKGMIFNPSYRETALEILGTPKIVPSKQLGLPWLLALARRQDMTLHDFAHRYLLEYMKPAEFGDGDAKEGVKRLFVMVLGDNEPIRIFAQTYLLCHHPTVGPEQEKSKHFGLKPYLKEHDYDPEAIWSMLSDSRADVRQFALQLVRPHLRVWNFHTRVYELVELDAKEVRNLAYAALEGAGNEMADPQVALKPEELNTAQIFQMTESTKRATRQLAMGLIRKHYTRLGGAERLGWLMQSADREVRLFAVRMLWEKHRPRAYPQAWKPRKIADVPLSNEGHFEDEEALRGLLRRLLFGLPPGRAPAGDSEVKRRSISANVIKKNIVDLVRDLGVEDAAFAALITPVLHEFSGSLARGEWQACLTALTHLHRAHPGLEILRALWRNTTSAISKKSVRSPVERGFWCWVESAKVPPAKLHSLMSSATKG